MQWTGRPLCNNPVGFSPDPSFIRARLIPIGSGGGKLGGGGGEGESELELQRQRLRDRRKKLERQLEEVRRTRQLHRDGRKRRGGATGVPTVALVG